MAVNAILAIFEDGYLKMSVGFWGKLFTHCRGSYPLPIGEVLKFADSPILGNGGSSFETSTPLKKFQGVLRVGGGGHRLETLRLNIRSREKVSAATPYPRGRPLKMGIFCTFLKVPHFFIRPQNVSQMYASGCHMSLLT